MGSVCHRVTSPVVDIALLVTYLATEYVIQYVIGMSSLMSHGVIDRSSSGELIRPANWVRRLDQIPDCALVEAVFIHAECSHLLLSHRGVCQFEFGQKKILSETLLTH